MKRRRARIVPVSDKNGATYWIIDERDREVRTIRIRKPKAKTETPTDEKP